MSSEYANILIARPQEVCRDQMASLELTLDSSEKQRASRFRFERDRRAYVVAHGLRRVALGDLLGVNPASLVLGKLSSGQPLLIWPRESMVFFSHAHARELVVFAMSGIGPVGIDVEPIGQTTPDFALLAPYIAIPGVRQRIAELGANAAEQFFFYWTALEAFWKATGKGFSPGNPRIRCEKNDAGTFEITLERGIGTRHSLPHARVSRIHEAEGCVISLVQQYAMDSVGRPSATLPSSTSKSSRHGKFFAAHQTFKYSGPMTIVSI